MKSSSRVLVVLAIISMALPALALGETWANAPLVDQHCAKKVAKDPDSHERHCAIECAGGGYGLYTADGKYLKFDAEGSKLALAALKASDQADHLRANVSGELAGDTIKVKTLELVK